MLSVITHPGRAHADEACSLAILLALYGGQGKVRVERREPTDTDLRSPDIWVIDVGGQISSERRNFDHHQLNPEEGKCTFTLLLDELNLREDFEEVFPWVQALAIADSQGPQTLANYAGVEPEALKILGPGPLQQGLLGLLGKSVVFDYALEDEPVLTLLREIGRNWLNTARIFASRMGYLLQHAKQVRAGNLSGMYIPRDEQLENNPVLGTSQLRDAWIEEDSFRAQFSLVQDQRGPGYVLYRYEDDPALDFSQLGGNERVKFAHKSGFLAVTKTALPLNELLQLVEKGVVR